MLLGDKADRDYAAVAVRDGRAKDSLAQEDAFGMVPQRTMPHVTNMGF